MPMILVIWGLALMLLTLIIMLCALHRSDTVKIKIEVNLFKGIKIEIQKDKPHKKGAKT